jgi:hypothetical protein
MMAQKVQIVLEDDLDGGPADETLSFSLDGISYEMDLSTENAANMREALAPYVGSARRVGGRARSGRRGGATATRNSSAEIRRWGRSNGFEVSERGRIPAELREAYQKANA